MNNEEISIHDMLDLARYPVDDLTTDRGVAFVNRCHQAYSATGLCALPVFITDPAQTVLAREANAVSQEAYFCRSTHNAYLTDQDPSMPANDVAQRQETTFVGSVPYDRLDKATNLRALYQWDPLMNFIGAVLGKRELHRFADPLGACSINVFVDGGEHGWHFDESEFTVTLMLQSPVAGGAFEYVPRIRDRDDEKAIVADVLNGDRSRVIELPFTAGTLLIFGGRQTLHRVSRVQGDRPRLVPVLCYSEQPDLQNSERVRKLFWGRTGTDAHA